MGSLQHLGFFIADRFGVKPPWRFHRCDGQHLGEMVLHHVPQGTRAFVVPSTFFYANGFGGGDLDA